MKTIEKMQSDLDITNEILNRMYAQKDMKSTLAIETGEMTFRHFDPCVKPYPNVKFFALSESGVRKRISFQIRKFTLKLPRSSDGVKRTSDSCSATPKT